MPGYEQWTVACQFTENLVCLFFVFSTLSLVDTCDFCTIATFAGCIIYLKPCDKQIGDISGKGPRLNHIIRTTSIVLLFACSLKLTSKFDFGPTPHILTDLELYNVFLIHLLPTKCVLVSVYNVNKGREGIK